MSFINPHSACGTLFCPSSSLLWSALYLSFLHAIIKTDFFGYSVDFTWYIYLYECCIA